MKLFIGTLILSMFILVTQNLNAEEQLPKEGIIEQGLRFCESTYPYKKGLLIANFGAEALNPLNDEGKGYISYFKDGEVSVLIATDGNLNAPKGMFEKDGYLYICDVNKVVVYNLNDLKDSPKTIKLPKGELFVNDLACVGNDLFVSVTNTGNIYKIDITSPAKLETITPQLWTNVVGANGLLIDGKRMYIASYPADGVTTENNVVYVIDNINKPSPTKLIQVSGQYDGLAISDDKQRLYVSNWVPAGVIVVDLSTKEVKTVEISAKLVGPADISLVNNTLFIPDLPNSRVIIKNISK